MKNTEVYFQDLGLIDYKETWEYQTQLYEQTIQQKMDNRTREKAGDEKRPTHNHLLFCQHPHVYTLGKSGDKNNLLLSEEQLKERHIGYYPINRGGDITYHGPGQLVGYPILDLDNFFTDIHKYLRFIEEAIIQTLALYNVDAGRIEGLTGVWIDYEKQVSPRKICAMGVKAGRWVTMHGFALNIAPALEYFDYIVPCGITDKAVTSLKAELPANYPISFETVAAQVKAKLAAQFGFNYV